MNAHALAIDNSEGPRLRQIARKLAMDIVPLDTILLESKMTQAEFEQLQHTRYFQDMLAEEVTNWSAAPNAAERVRIKYLTITEEIAPDMYTALLDPKIPLGQRADLLKTVAKLAGLDKTGPDAGAAGRVKITINMGASKDPSTPSVAPVTIETDYHEGGSEE
jgi:hypothetical protein